MGAGNVTMAFLHWNHLPDRPFRVLTRMAVMSLDKDDPPKYFAGREDLAFCLGRQVSPEPDSADKSDDAEAIRRERRSVFEIVRRAVSELIEAGVISSSGDARFNRQATYSLHLDPLTQQTVAPLTQQTVAPLTQQTVAPLTQQTVAPATTDRSHRPNKSLDADPTEHCPLGGDEEDEPSLRISGGYKSPKTRKLRVVNDPDDFEDDPPLTQEQERNRQAAALRELMKNEPAASEPEW